MHVSLRTNLLLTLILTFLLGCSVTPQRDSTDVYANNVIFTVPMAAGVPAMAASYAGAENESAQTIISAVLSFHGLRKVTQFSIRTMNAEAVVAEIGPRQTIKDVIHALSTDLRVQSVDMVKQFKLMSYNDPYFALQNTVKGDRIDQIHALSTGKNVVVGIIDTGVDRAHPELKRSIIYAGNFVAHDQGSFDLDEHGTAVAGVIGSAANNDLGIVGVAPDVDMMIFKACHQDVTSRRTSCDSVSIIKALNRVLIERPDILNMSLSGPRDPIIERLLKTAHDQGIVLVAAVDQSRENNKSFPANMPEVIAVGTSINLDTDFMNMVLAPGTDILTTAPGATYGFKSGSSMATAYVSGIAALMIERAPNLTSAEIYRYLKASARAGDNHLPVVDLCVAVHDVVSTPGYQCRLPAVAVHDPKTKSRFELTH
jgi:subtilisin family serine protease